jgi:hypothetical protein
MIRGSGNVIYSAYSQTLNGILLTETNFK